MIITTEIMTSQNIHAILTEARRLWQAKQLAEAKRLYEQLIHADETLQEAWSALGVIHGQSQNYAEADRCFQKLIQLNPDNPEPHYMLGCSLTAQQRNTEAIESYHRAIELKPDFPEAMCNLSTELTNADNREGASDLLFRIIELHPNYLSAHYNLGLLRKTEARYQEAEDFFQTCITLNPNIAEVHYSLGHTFLAQQKWSQAEQHLRRAVQLNPGSAEAHYNLGLTLHSMSQAVESETALRQAAALNPQNADIQNILGNALILQGKVTEAMEHYHRATASDPNHLAAHSNILLALHYRSDHKPEEIRARHAAFGERCKALNPKPIGFPTQSNHTRKLRIGYISPDFRQHSVAYFARALFDSRDKHAFDAICYSDTVQPDSTTAWFQKHATHWRDTSGLPNDSISQLIRDDRVDILVDLAAHTNSKRMGVLAQKPAPVLITYLGYPDTTGLDTVDYRISDYCTDPRGNESFCVEKLLRLPDCFLCYAPPGEAPAVAPPPNATNRFVTFGSFNNIAKLSPEAISTWSAILSDVPDSRLVLKTRGFQDPRAAESYYQAFEGFGIERERLQFNPWRLEQQDHLNSYSEIDIALDTYPYNGTTTSCEALWMGVPVITLSGKRHASRVGISLLSQLGLQKYIAADEAQYRALAVELAGDLSELTELRTALRQRMADSVLCDTAGFSSAVEILYREVWSSWCSDNHSDGI